MDHASFGAPSRKRSTGFMRRVSGARRTLSETKTFVIEVLTNGLPNNQTECEAQGYYWYDNACHLKPKEEFDWQTVILVSTVVGIGLAVVLSLK